MNFEEAMDMACKILILWGALTFFLLRRLVKKKVNLLHKYIHEQYELTV